MDDDNDSGFDNFSFFFLKIETAVVYEYMSIKDSFVVSLVEICLFRKEFSSFFFLFHNNAPKKELLRQKAIASS